MATAAILQRAAAATMITITCSRMQLNQHPLLSAEDTVESCYFGWTRHHATVAQPTICWLTLV